MSPAWCSAGARARLAPRTASGPPADAPDAVQIDDLLVWVTLGVVLGGRSATCCSTTCPTTSQNPLEILKVWHGGMSFHGGLLGVLAAILLFARAQRARRARAARPGRRGGADRPVLRAHRQLHQRRALGPADRRALGHRVSRTAARLPRHPSQLYEAGARGPACCSVVLVAGDPARRLSPAGLRRRASSLSATALARIVVRELPRAGRRSSTSSARWPHHGHAAVAADDAALGLALICVRCAGRRLAPRLAAPQR